MRTVANVIQCDPDTVRAFNSSPREDIDQLKRIMEVVGTPTPELLKKICSEHVSEGVWSEMESLISLS